MDLVLNNSLCILYMQLSPSDKSLHTDWETELNEAKEYVRKLNVISTNKDREAETEVDDNELEDKYPINQKWNLCEALLTVGDWHSAEQLIDKLPTQSVIVNEPVAKALAKMIGYIIDPIYAQITGKTPSVRLPYDNGLNVPQAETLMDLRAYAFPMSIKLGPAMYTDPILIYKLVRLMHRILTNCKATPNSTPKKAEDEQLYYDSLTLLDASILPALSYMDCNCCVAEEIWSVVKFFPYQCRYSLYARWKNETYLVHPRLIRRRGDSQKQIKALMKRVSKENVKPVGRSIGKLSHCAPGFLFDYVSFKNKI